MIEKLTGVQIMSQYLPAYSEDGTWGKAIQSLMESPSDSRVILRLIEILRTEGKFREPVIVLPAAGNDPYQKIVASGNHRVVAAYLAGNFEIEVSNNFYEFADHTTTTVIKGFGMDKLNDELADLLVDLLRSVEVDSSLWVTSGATFGDPKANKVEIAWDTLVDNSKEASLKEIIKGIVVGITKNPKGIIENFRD